jgi:hypothetical protein
VDRKTLRKTCHDTTASLDRICAMPMPTSRAPDPKMLEAWDVLENWDLLTRNDVDVILSTVQPADELLLEYQDEG